MSLSMNERNEMLSSIGLRLYDGHLDPWEQNIELGNTKLFLLSQLQCLTGLPQIIINNEIKRGKIKVVD